MQLGLAARRNYTDSVVFAVTDVDQSTPRGEDSVRPRELALERITVRTIAALASAGNEFDLAVLKIYATNRMAFRIGEVNILVGADADAFGAGKCGLINGTVLKTLRASSRDVVIIPLAGFNL